MWTKRKGIYNVFEEKEKVASPDDDESMMGDDDRDCEEGDNEWGCLLWR